MGARLFIFEGAESQHGVKVGDLRTRHLKYGTGKRGAATTTAARRDGPAAQAAAARNKIGRRIGTLRSRLVDAAQQAAGVGAVEIDLGQFRAIALNFNIDIILQRQRDGIGQRQIQHIAADERFDAPRIIHVDARNGALTVILREPIDVLIPHGSLRAAHPGARLSRRHGGQG